MGSSVNSMEKLAIQTAIQHQREAEVVLQTEIFQARTDGGLLAQADIKPNRFIAILSGKDIAPNSVSTSANGALGAVLVENRLVVRGSFGNLSSGLRDYATDPSVPPNPNITSGVHIHRGSPTENGPFQHALQVESAKDGLSGSLRGEYTLTPEQLQALNSGGLYVDLHTKTFRAGELRGILKADK